jgi:pre-mRNA-splicing factor SYF1
MWTQLCDIISKHPDSIKSIHVEPVLRSGIRSYPTEVADLWCTLASYYINMGQFDKAFDVYEEGMEDVCTVRDWNQIFDAYASVCDEIVSSKMAALEEEAENQESETEDELFTVTDDLEMFIAKYEYLMERRPFLSNSVKLRQNPHNVHEWHKRAKLYATVPDDNKKKKRKDKENNRENDQETKSEVSSNSIMKSDEMVVKTYSAAVLAVDPFQAVGKAFTLWTSFARFYETRYRNIESARKIFEKAVLTKQPSVDDLVSVWCDYIEMEMRHRNWFEAKALLERATRTPTREEYEKRDYVQNRVHKHVRLWSLFADIEEALSKQSGDISSTVAIYEKMIDLKIASPRIILNYAEFLQEHKHYEQSFQAYERGVNLFYFPQVYHIWIMYLTKFVQRYKGTKLERARDLFEQAVTNVPPEFARNLYLLYGQLEENYGLARHAMNVYDRGARAVQDNDMYDMYLVYINRAAQYYGITKTRDIYERAIQGLPSNKQIRDMCLKYADLERKLGEIDRARAIFAHAAKFCDPRVDPEFWTLWTQFEKAHGNIDTFKEMLRIRRSVEASNASVNIMTSSMLVAQQESEKRDAEAQRLKLKRKREEEGGSVTARDIEALERAQVQSNPDEMEI